MLLLVSVNLIPIVVAVFAWWTELKRRNLAGRSRTLLFRTGLVAATAASLLLVSFVLYSLNSHGGVEAHDFASRLLWIPSAILGLLTLPLALFGTGKPRMMTIGCSLSLLLLLYVAGLATSY